MFTHIALLGLALVPAPTHRYSTVYRPRIELSTDRGDNAVYTRGERVRVRFQLDQDAYVTIFRVDTDGRVRVLFPREPWEDNFARGGKEFEVDGDQLRSEAFSIDDYPGVGYLFAVASADPFTYDGIETNDHWDYRVIADGRVRGDPYVAMTDLAQRIVPEGYVDWDYDVVSYNVERHYDYPRFLCYDCHSYVSYSNWDPYFTSCVRFRMYVYDDPWYYPYRYYGGDRVVFARPYRPQPRFIFKDWGTSRPNREEFVTRERERPVNDNTRRGVTGRDLGGSGIIPPPDVRGGDNATRRGNDTRGRDDNLGGRVNPNTGDQPARRDRPDDATRLEQPRIQPTVRGDDQRKIEPRVVEPRPEPRRDEPRREEPRRVEPRPEPRREEPRRAEPRNEQPRNEPRAEPRKQSPPPAAPPPPPPARNEPEVRRRKP
ncbi:MAG TPA: DUF4384 domain-containing protein [Gemmatimonadales bacterium]|nr:DUF4384 domain-containing protein [Gemmatimonadales bacterium]